MQSAQKISVYGLALLFGLSGISTWNMNSSAPIELSHETEASPFTAADHLILETQQQLDHIGIMLVTLSGILSNKQVSLDNKAIVLKQLRTISACIHELRTRKFADADITIAYELIYTTNLIMNHMLESIKSNFTNMSKKNLMSILKNSSMPETISPQMTLQLFMLNQSLAAQLTYKIDHYGLRWYNHAYRILDDYVLTPCHRHSIPRRVLLGAATLSFGLYLWWQLGYDSFNSNAPTFLKKLFGDVPREPGMGRESDGVVPSSANRVQPIIIEHAQVVANISPEEIQIQRPHAEGNA